MNKTSQELKNLNLYYNRPADELIFLTISEHMKLHLNHYHPYRGKPQPQVSGLRNGMAKFICPLKVAYMYCKQNKSQGEIGRELGASYQKISRVRKEYNIPKKYNRNKPE